MNGQDLLISIQTFSDTLAENIASFEAATEKRVLATCPQILAIDTDTPDDDNLRADLHLFSAAPVSVVPKYSAFAPLATNGHRFLMASDGMYIEVRRPWLYVVHRLAEQTAVTMPFGSIEPCTQLKFGRISQIVPDIQRFAAAAIDALPNEHADMLVWDSISEHLTDANVSILEATPDLLTYECRELDDYESVAVDLHSHGASPAFFSATDNQDDAGAVKLSVVIGDLDKPQPTIAVRLCLLGLYLPIPVPAEKIFAGMGAL